MASFLGYCPLDRITNTFCYMRKGREEKGGQAEAVRRSNAPTHPHTQTHTHTHTHTHSHLCHSTNVCHVLICQNLLSGIYSIRLCMQKLQKQFINMKTFRSIETDFRLQFGRVQLQAYVLLTISTSEQTCHLS